MMLLLCCAGSAFAARMTTITGRVTDEKGAPVEFASVVLLQDGRQVTGITTDAEGVFSLKAAEGDYTLCIQFVGYETLTREVHLDDGTELGDFVLRISATEIEDVVVSASLIRREADRFVVDVANSPVAVGKDGEEILKTAPGVWISDDKISINGQSGSKVYVNDRELKMEPAQLLTYLRSLKAEDILRIEVVPVSGSDFDADSSAGIIKITLKRKRDDGMVGSVDFNTSQGKWVHSYGPSMNINYHQGRFDLYASAWANISDDRGVSHENTFYRLSDMEISAESVMKERDKWFDGKIGGIVELNPKHSLGAEFEYWGSSDVRDNRSQTTIQQGHRKLSNQSLFPQDEGHGSCSVSLNYIVKLDTMGSTLKLLADYMQRTSRNDNDNRTVQEEADLLRDSLYRDNSTSNYRILTASLGLEKIFSPKWQLRAGAKYTRNDMRNGTEYRWLDGETWVPSTVEDYRMNYVENIAALYAVASARLGRFGIVAGLRGEYTRTDGKADDVSQNYFSLFPNANLSWSMDEAGKHSLILSYSRTIQRPGFWSLSPRRVAISDYTYQTGNPELNPAYSNRFDLTLVLCRKYSLSLGANWVVDGIQQELLTDPEDPNKLFLTSSNFPDYNTYYVSLALPFQLTKWWSWNVNASGLRLAQRLDSAAPLEHFNFFVCYTNMTFQLPANFTFGLTYFGQTSGTVGNLTMAPRHELNVSLSKRFWKDRFTVTVKAQHLLNRNDVFTSDQAEFVRTLDVAQNWGKRSFQLRLSYNFKAGKSFRSRSVESGAEDEKSRM